MKYNQKIEKQVLAYLKKLDQLEAKRVKIMKRFYLTKEKYEIQLAKSKIAKS